MSNQLNAAETWEKVYKAFEEINFTAYDFDAVKQSLIDYMKFYYPENFNDYTENSQILAIIGLFSYVAELLAYRNDMSTHEVLLDEADRKQSILKLARLISYSATRNLPLRGLVKIHAVSISEDVRDSQSNSLANKIIKWNDAANSLWREQFFLVMNKVLTQSFGNPFKTFQIDDSVFQQYEVQNLLETEADRSSFRNGVLKFKTKVNGIEIDFELVPADVDSDGVYERAPNPNSYFTILHSDDGYGDSSDTTGFMMYVKQGTLMKLPYVFDSRLPMRAITVDVPNINDVDVWVQEVDEQGVIIDEWTEVPNINGMNLAFNDISTTKKYEVETLEDDKIKVIFGDGDFAAIPTGIFNIWVRQSNSGDSTVSKNEIANKTVTFLYTSKLGKQESCTFTYSLVSALQNASKSEDIEHIRSAAPATNYSQNRMVNGQDYNSFPLSDPSILRCYAVNRTFAGQPKYLPWNDASGQYQNVKLFGNDLRMYYAVEGKTEISQISSRSLIDEVLEPALSEPGIYNTIVYAFYTSGSPLSLAMIHPRTRFIEDSTQEIDNVQILEKTEIQGALDRHWYGEPDSTVQLDVDLSESSSLLKSVYAIVNDDTDQRIYDPTMKMVTKNDTTGVYTSVDVTGSVSGYQEAVIRQKKFGIKFNPDRAFTSALRINPADTDTAAIPETDTLSSSDITQSAANVEFFTIEVTDTDGTFSVYGSKSGFHPAGKVGEAYDNGIISFLVGFPADADTTLYLGDAFIVDVTYASSTYSPTIYKKNLTGRFEIVNETELTADVDSAAYDVSDAVASWIMLVERMDDENGNVNYWKITKRNFSLVVESPTTNFWYNPDMTIVDPDTKKRVTDKIRILKSNLDATGTVAIAEDQVYSVVSDVKRNDGEVNSNALSVTPVDLLEVYFSGDGAPQNSIEYLKLIGTDNYVYFSKDTLTGYLTPVTATAYLESLTYDANGLSEDELYVRKIGRDDLDFMWQHFSPHTNLIDPSPSNVHDIYVMTRGYYSRVQNYLKGIESTEPAPPTALELRNTYRNLVENKMMSDTIVFHSGRVKFLFGKQAQPELRARFKAVRAPTAKLTGDQIRAKILNVINEYFQIDYWDFGKSFYATHLCSVIHSALSTEVSSVVLVPEFPSNYFGDLFFLKSQANEIFVSCCALENIEIVDGIDRVTLKQKS